MSGIIDHLEVGQVFPVLLVDGIADTPTVAGTLSLLDRGVSVTVPYVQQDAQFAAVERWFRAHELPPHFLAYSNDLRISLFGCQFSGHSERHGSLSSAEGRFEAEEALMKQWEGAHDQPLLVEEVQSEIDGLYEFSRLSSVCQGRETTGEGRTLRNKLTYTVEGVDGLKWQQGEATLSISTSWHGEANQGVNIVDQAVLHSTFPTPRPFKDHLAEQRKFIAFLSIVFGKPIAFRKHKVRDENLPGRTMDGVIHSYPFVELISRQTVRDLSSPVPDHKEFLYALTQMPAISADVLKSWGEGYEERNRFLLPLVGLLRVRDLFMENKILNAAMSLEAYGKGIVTYIDGEEDTYWRGGPTTATFILRGVQTLEVPWTPLAPSAVALARAIKDNYNSIKHPRDAFPDPLVTQILGEMAVGVARLLALKLVASAEEWERVDKVQPFRRAMDIASANSVTVNEDGTVNTSS